jgi:hypothetical protein
MPFAHLIYSMLMPDENMVDKHPSSSTPKTPVNSLRLFIFDSAVLIKLESWFYAASEIGGMEKRRRHISAFSNSGHPAQLSILNVFTGGRAPFFP